MTPIGQHIYNGMAAAACVLGFLFVLTGAAVALFLIVYGVLLIAQSGEAAAKRKEVSRNDAASAQHHQPYGHAPAVGRHVRKGP